jgi:hypothetical protein
MAFIDHCQTAEDVRKQASRVMERRRAQYRKSVAELHAPKIEPVRVNFVPPVPLPVTDIFWDGHLWTGGFACLVQSAYPRLYPDKMVEADTITGWRPDVGEIVRCMADAAGISVNDIVSDCRKLPLIIPRHLAMALAKRLTGKSLPHIGRVIGMRDHTTVLHAVEKMEPVILATVAAMPKRAALDDWCRTALELTKTIRLNKPQWRRARARG